MDPDAALDPVAALADAIAFPSINAADLFSVLGIGMGDGLAEAKRILPGVARGTEGVLPGPPPRWRAANDDREDAHGHDVAHGGG